MEANIGFYVALCLTQVPVAALLYFIYRKDELKPEPVTALLLTFVIIFFMHYTLQRIESLFGRDSIKSK
ncbi:MAG: hypothetical protein IJ700_01400 [Bacteroidaceae bacterium]|nr:hypothetical protein [Bacteroidaceae bacterium]